MPITPIADSYPSDAFDAPDVTNTPVPRTSTVPAAHPGVALLGRCMLAAIFIASGAGKLADLAGTATMMTHQGIPYADTLALVAGLAEVLGGAALVLGLLTRTAAVGLVLFLIPTTLIFHDFWNYDGTDQKMQLANFMKNLAITGGLVVLAAVGPGGASLDGKIRRARALRLQTRSWDRW